jgi:hypothetical protein
LVNPPCVTAQEFDRGTALVAGNENITVKNKIARFEGNLLISPYSIGVARCGTDSSYGYAVTYRRCS